MPPDVAAALAKAREQEGLDPEHPERGAHQTFEFEGTIHVRVEIDRGELLAEWFREQSDDPSVTVKNLAYNALMKAAMPENLADLFDEEVEWGGSRITWDVDLG